MDNVQFFLDHECSSRFSRDIRLLFSCTIFAPSSFVHQVTTKPDEFEVVAVRIANGGSQWLDFLDLCDSVRYPWVLPCYKREFYDLSELIVKTNGCELDIHNQTKVRSIAQSVVDIERPFRNCEHIALGLLLPLSFKFKPTATFIKRPRNVFFLVFFNMLDYQFVKSGNVRNQRFF